MHLLFLIPLFSVWSHAAGRTTAGHRAASGRTAADHTASASSMGPTPTCFQPQKSTGPRPSAISSVLSSAIPQACDPDQQKSVEYHHHLIHTYHVDSLNFNISDASTATIDNRAVKPRSLCSKAFHNIISACIKPNEGAGFWGGWVVSERSNYSISNFAYPKNGLLSSGSTKGLLKPSKTKLDSSLSKEPTKIATSGVKSHSESSQSPETTHPTTGSHRHRSRLNSKPHTSKESSGSNNKPSQHKTDTLTHHGTRTGIGTTGKPHRTSPRSGGSTRKPHHTGTANDSSAISDSKSGTGTGKHRTDTDSKPKSLMSSQPGHPSKHSPHTSPHVTTGTSTPDPKGPTQRPGQTMITSGPVGIPTKHIDPSSPVATSEGIVIGGLLFSFSKNAKDRLTDITIPATKTAVLDDLEDTEDQLETLFTDMGGSLPPDTGGCGGGGGRRRKRGLFDLAGDVFNTVRCAINSVDSLKSHIDVPEPDIPRIEADLKDIGTLADGVDEDDNKTKDDNDHTKTDDGKSTREPSTKEPTTTEPAKTTDSTSSFSSTARSSSNPCLDGPATTGGIRKRADKGDTCDYKCPSPIPAAPTTGPLAITPAPTDEGDAQQKRGRELAGRIYLVKRAKGSITKINDCALTTPSSDPVTTPNHPGGFAFWQQDKNGQLPASFQTISRYYRTTDGVNQQCAPTVTAVPAQQLTPNQNDQNEIISVDHACK